MVLYDAGWGLEQDGVAPPEINFNTGTTFVIIALLDMLFVTDKIKVVLKVSGIMDGVLKSCNITGELGELIVNCCVFPREVTILTLYDFAKLMERGMF